MKPIHILVAEDDANIRTGLVDTLESEGYRATPAMDGKQAIEIFEAGSFDLVLLDVMMPGVDGFEVSRTLRDGNQQKKVPVVFVTSKDDSKSMQEGFRSGGRVYLTKPFTNFQLVKMVKSIIGD